MTKTTGWFSRRYKTAEAHIAAQAAKLDRENEWRKTMERNAQERANRTPKQQLAVLDKRLGKGQGAKRERTRLRKQIEKKQ